MEAPYEEMRPLPYKGLKITTVVMGVIGLVLWGCGIGFPIGYCINNGYTLIWSIVFVPLNIGYIYYTMRIIYIITSVSFPCESDLAGVRDYTSKLVAAMAVGAALFVIATIWFAVPPTFKLTDEFNVAFGCSFSFLWSLVVFPMATAYTRKVSLIYFGLKKMKVPKVMVAGYHEHPYGQPPSPRQPRKSIPSVAPTHGNRYY